MTLLLPNLTENILVFITQVLESVEAKSRIGWNSFAKHKQKWPKLTTGAARILGNFAKKNIVHLN